MKFLGTVALQKTASDITNNPSGCPIDFRLESYSCKMVQSDKKQWKLVEKNDTEEIQPLSPPDSWQWSGVPSRRARRSSEVNSGSEAGIAVDVISKRTLFDLTSVLNASFDDYDFSSLKSDMFSLMPNFATVVAAVEARLNASVLKYDKLSNSLWTSVCNEITPEECNIYSYNPGAFDDPFNEPGVIWSFNYFFVNRRLKRILFMSCRPVHKYSQESN